MWNKIKKLLQHGLNVVVAVVLVVACGAYVLINSVLMTAVINDLRLDTYITHHTGGSIVLLILLLGWGPVWLARSLRDRR